MAFQAPQAIPSSLVTAIEVLPPERVLLHCGHEQRVPVLDIYAYCTVCNAR